MDYQMTIVNPNTGQVTLGIPTIPTLLTGLDELVQVVVLSILRNPGKSVLFPVEGSGLRADIGKYNVSTSSPPTELQARVVQAVQTVQQEVISRQDPTQGSPDSRLSSLVLKGFAFDSTTLAAVLQIQIIAESGDSTNILV